MLSLVTLKSLTIVVPTTIGLFFAIFSLGRLLKPLVFGVDSGTMSAGGSEDPESDVSGVN